MATDDLKQRRYTEKQGESNGVSLGKIVKVLWKIVSVNPHDPR